MADLTDEQMNKPTDGFRHDSDTGEEITEGFCFNDGDYYTGSKKKALEYAIKQGYKDLQESYDEEYHYWTTWHNE